MVLLIVGLAFMFFSVLGFIFGGFNSRAIWAIVLVIGFLLTIGSVLAAAIKLLLTQPGAQPPAVRTQTPARFGPSSRLPIAPLQKMITSVLRGAGALPKSIINAIVADFRKRPGGAPVPSHAAGAPLLYTSPIEVLERAAKRGNVEAQRFFGIRLYQGNDIDKDGAQAAKWLRRAAERGDSSAQNHLANILIKGEGVAIDTDQAVLWLLKSAGAGNAWARRRLGRMYQDGEGLTRDMGMAILWFQRAADSGDWNAIASVEQLVPNRMRTPQDETDAASWNREFEARVKEIQAASSNRWPEHLFPRVPVNLLFVDRTNLNTREDLWGWWSRMLDEYPTAPKADLDRKAREKTFWNNRMTDCIASSGASLLPKQTIIDDWWRKEKWMSRYYYAATGIFHECHHGSEFIRLMDNATEADAAGKNYIGYHQRSAAHMLNRSSDELERNVEITKKYKVQWGEWYFNNIERAFRDAFPQFADNALATHQPFGNSELASEPEAVDAAAKGGVRMSSVHTREF